MKKIATILSFLILTTQFLTAQSPQGGVAIKIGKISGQIIDANTKEPMEYATVAVYKEADSSLVTGSITTTNGNFRITDIPVGNMYLKIDFLGYKTLIKRGVSITFDAPEVKLKKIAIEPYESMLEGVDIVAERPLYQNQIDRRVINPEQDVMAQGGSALEVLENAPSVEVDIEGNVALRGNTSVTILIDGRPSGYSGESAGDLLQQIPTNSIDKIEIITNPSSKYDPEGVTGIINIIMKKNTLEGFNGTVNAGGSTQLDYNAGMNLNYRNEWMSLYSNLGVGKRKYTSTGTNYKESYFENDTLFFDQKSRNESGGLNLNARLGIDFLVNRNNTLSITGRISGGNRNNDQSTSYLNGRTNREEKPDQKYISSIESKNHRFSYNAGALWETKFSSKDHFLLVDLSYGQHANDQTSYYDQYSYVAPAFDSIIFDYSRKNMTNGKTGTFEGKVDYAMPIKERSKFEAGGSVRTRDMENDLEFGYKRDGDYIVDNNQTNKFIYDENIFALYAQFGSKFGKFSYQVGLRGEYAEMKGDSPSQGDDISNSTFNSLDIHPANFSSDYFELYPTAFIMYQIKETDELKLNYTRRVNRPGPWNLNPYQNVIDTMNISIGNPKLKPEFINALELSYFKYLKNGSLSTTLFYRNTTDVISRYTEINSDGVTISSWANLNTTNAYGLELVFNNRFFKVWSLTASANLGYSSINGKLFDENISNSGVNWGINMNNSFSLTETTTLQFNGRYNGPRITAQGEFMGFFVADIGLKQDFLKKRLSVTLRISDVFNTMEYESYSRAEKFYQHSSRNPRSLLGFLNISYKFGNMQMREMKRRTSSNGDEYQNGDNGIDMY
ncbi:MAG: TonB-dependent receptor [Bacteroidales bacterium]|jgi:outer membrane receptor protein involved in Fe transport|nr:TonB-dependent receptor [Bacteroidales bacterium]